MNERHHLLFEAPLMHQMARQGGGQAESAPAFELTRWELREGSHQFSGDADLMEMAKHYGLAQIVNFGPAFKLMDAIEKTRGNKGIYTVLYRNGKTFDAWYIGISKGAEGISERLRDHMHCLRFAKRNLNKFYVQWADLPHLTDKQLRTIEHALIVTANNQLKKKLVNISSTQPFKVLIRPLHINVKANPSLQISKPIYAKAGDIVKEWEWL